MLAEPLDLLLLLEASSPAPLDPVALLVSCTSRDCDRAGDPSSRASRSLVYWFRPFFFWVGLLLFDFDGFDDAAVTGGVSGDRRDGGGGGSTCGIVSSFVAMGRLAVARAASGSSSEGSESVSV